MIAYFLSLSVFTQLVIIYFISVNVAVFFVFGYDKLKARLGGRRLSEKWLWGLSFLGGSLGAFLGMNFFRHKTKKAAFQTGLLLIFLSQAIIVFMLLK